MNIITSEHHINANHAGGLCCDCCTAKALPGEYFCASCLAKLQRETEESNKGGKKGGKK